jgi:hypothetical protein
LLSTDNITIINGKVKTRTFGVSYEDTLVFSENINAFSGFYSFRPEIYLHNNSSYFTPNPELGKDVYIHNKGIRCSFYDKDPDKSLLRLIVNPSGDQSKVFNNIEYLSQILDQSSNDIFDETLSSIKVYNEYQDSGKVDLTVDDNVRRRMRSWRTNIPRDSISRIRNPYTTIEFDYLNNENKKLILNDIITYYVDTPM